VGGVGGGGVTLSQSQTAMAGGAIFDPTALVPKGNAARLPDAKKAEIAAQMKALRESIESDFDATKSKGDKAGYLPPPPMGR
jgi:hypothetical protein